MALHGHRYVVNSTVQSLGSSFNAKAPLFEGLAAATDSRAFMQQWLDVALGKLPQVHVGLLLAEDSSGAIAPAAMWPGPVGDISDLLAPAQTCVDTQRQVLTPLDVADRTGSRFAIANPILTDGQLMAVVVVSTQKLHPSDAAQVASEIRWGAGWLELMFRQRAMEVAASAQARTLHALDLLALVAEHERVDDACVAIATELARRHRADRVAIGLARRPRARLSALSHAAWFERRSALAVLLEHAMTEAIEQRELLTWPAHNGKDEVLVVQAQRQLAGDGAAVTVPILAGARAVGAITWQLPGERITDEFISECRAIAVVLGPILARLDDQSRWLSGSAVAGVGRGWRALTDPRRPSFAVGATLILGALGWVALVDTNYRVTAKAVLEGQLQRVVAAPFEGFIAEAPARAGQTVLRGALLVRLDDRDLRLEQTRLAAEITQNERKRDEAVAARDKAAISVAAAQVAEVEARLAQVEDRLLRTRVEAPFDGVVVSGDLSQSIGGPVEQGKTLFELAPMSGYRVVLKVDERDVRRVSPGQRGELVLPGTSGDRQAFTVRNVSTAGVEDGLNVFRVEAELDATDAKLRPGMEGVGKLKVGEETLLWIWTHRLVDWVRMAIWRYLP